MFFQSKNIRIDFTHFDQLRSYIRKALDDVKADNISSDEFIEAIESCFSDESPLSWDDCLLVRAVKEPNNVHNV